MHYLQYYHSGFYLLRHACQVLVRVVGVLPERGCAAKWQLAYAALMGFRYSILVNLYQSPFKTEARSKMREVPTE